MSEHTRRSGYEDQYQTIIKRDRRQLMDVVTGEVIYVDQITKRTNSTRTFWKCYLMDFITVLGIIDSKQLDVLLHIIENTNASNNLFIGTYSKIAKETNCSSRTISIVLKKLQEADFLKKVQNGVWRINPNILMKGNENKRQLLLSYYKGDDPVEQITLDRAMQEPQQVENRLKGQFESFGTGDTTAKGDNEG